MLNIRDLISHYSEHFEPFKVLGGLGSESNPGSRQSGSLGLPRHLKSLATIISELETSRGRDRQVPFLDPLLPRRF